MRTIFLLAVFCAGPLGASAAGEPGLSPQALFLTACINVAILVFLIVKLGGASIRALFTDREEQIRTAFESYRAAYEQAEAEIARLRAVIAALPAEKERVLADYRRRAEELYETRMAAARLYPAGIGGVDAGGGRPTAACRHRRGCRAAGGGSRRACAFSLAGTAGRVGGVVW